MVKKAVRPGPRNLITDVDGLRVGNSGNERIRSGVTVVIPDCPAIISVDARGGATGTRDLAALEPEASVQDFHGLCLSGGSVFGLDAASGVTDALSARGVGLDLGPRRVPVVPAAILFDLMNGGDKGWTGRSPYHDLGLIAARNAGHDFALGSVGAGHGAQAGAIRGGLGSASAITAGGVQAGALVAVNSCGSVLIPGTLTPWAWYLEQDGEFGNLEPPGLEAGQGVAMDVDLPRGVRLAENTTIAVVATNLDLTKAELKRMAIMAGDGLARAIRPVHTPFDGDVVFALATAKKTAPAPRAVHLTDVGAIAADCLARAVVRAILAAGSGVETGLDVPAYRDLRK